IHCSFELPGERCSSCRPQFLEFLFREETLNGFRGKKYLFVLHVDRELSLTVFMCPLRPLFPVDYLGHASWCEHVPTRTPLGPLRRLHRRTQTCCRLRLPFSLVASVVIDKEVLRVKLRRYLFILLPQSLKVEYF